MIDLLVVATTFATVFVVELPDKTFVATLVLTTRYRAALAWAGVALAFLVQTGVAVLLGGLLARLPSTPVAVAASLLFAVGAVVLWRSAAGADDEEAEAEEEMSAKVRTGATGLRAVGASFLVLFLAEWGDLSQLLTASLAARYDDPLSVFVGAWGALLLVSGLAALLGRALLARLRLPTIRRTGAVVCAVLAVVTALEAAGLLSL